MKFSLFFLLIIFPIVLNKTLGNEPKINPFTLASYYNDNMVLQRAPYNAIIWGFANINSIIGTTVNGRTYSTAAETVSWTTKYVWTIKLDPISSNQPFNIRLDEVRPDGVSSLTINNVVFGDIWVCSGQSNMQWSLINSFNATDEINNANIPNKYSKVRVFTASLKESTVPLYDLNGINQKWAVATGSSITYFSAVCWHFGRRVFEETGVPIGLISTNWGGTNIEKWTTTKVIDNCRGNRQGNDQVLWNAMIHPFFKFPVTGALWYQGESNTGYNRDVYDCIQAGMIEEWRQSWYDQSKQSTNPSFPFGFVQLANGASETSSVGSYPVVRWRQSYNYGYTPNPQLKNVFMGTAVDLVEIDPNYADQIHPRDKTNVGLRLSWGALALYYNIRVEYYSPRVNSITYANSVATISFESEFQPIRFTVKNKKGFETCCNNDNCPIDNLNNWKQVSDFTIANDKLTFNLPTGCNTLNYVRYAWRQKPCEYQQCALYSTASQLPIYPFYYKI